MTPELEAVLTIVEHTGIAALSLYLWWVERGERIKLQEKLDACLEAHTEHDAGAT